MTGDIFIYGEIGTERGQISAANVRAQLELPENRTADEIILHIMSGGGDVDEGEGIYNALKNSGKKITTHIEGTCASIATLIAAAGQKVVMNTTGRFMIHNPQFQQLNGPLDAHGLRRLALRLDQVKTLLVGVYDKKTSLGKDKLWELYDNETWLTASQAEQMGFVDESTDAIIKAVAKIDLKNLSMEKNENWFKDFFKSFTSKTKIKNELVKNQMTETLASGQVIVVDSEDGNWTGKKVVTETGEQLPPGEHPLVSGKILVVGEGSVITEVKEAPAAEDKTQQDMENQKIKELEAKLAASEAALATATAKATETETKAAATVAKMENRAMELESKFLKLSEEVGKTVGDNSRPLGPVIKALADEVGKADPMGEDALKFYRNRNMIPHEQD